MPSMRRDDVRELARLCAQEEWRKVKDMADSFATKDAGPARFFQAISRLHLGEYLAAWFCCERALSEFRDSSELLDLSGRICAALGDKEAAQVFHERALASEEVALHPALAYNYANSMARLEEWDVVYKIVSRYGEKWDAGLRESLAFGLRLATSSDGNLESLKALGTSLNARSPHALSVAQRLQAAGALEEADELMQKCFLVGNEIEISANRVLMWLEAGEVSRAFSIWRHFRDEIRSNVSLAACIQAQLLMAMGADVSALRLFEGHRGVLRDARMRELRDHFCVTHSDILRRRGKPRDARRLLVHELQSTAGALEKTLRALRACAVEMRSTILHWWEVAFSRDGDHQVKLRVAAPSNESARSLAIEALPQSLQALPLSVCRIIEEPAPQGLGVFERHIGYRISRDLLQEFEKE